MIKLYINESNLLETLEDIKKYYPRIPDDIFKQLIELDPPYRGNDSAGKYGKWLLNLYNKGNLPEESFDEVTPLLNQFTTYRNRIQNKDLNSYKSLDDLADILASVVDDDSMLTPRQKVRFLKNVKSGKTVLDKSDDYEIVLETPKFIVYVPNTHEASMKLGKGTEWCTAHENPEWYKNYTENGGKLYIIKDKKTGDRWQYSDLTGDFLDKYDEKFNVAELMQQDEKLSKFFEKFLSADYYNFDGTWVYNGRNIPQNIKPTIKSIIISDNVIVIGYGAFMDCSSLESITIPNSVIEIGGDAFAGCSSLESITIPNSVITIDYGAFDGCISLKTVTIPDSVTTIGYGAFVDCSSLESVIIPNSVTEIEFAAFDGCTSSLTVYTNNEYAKEYCQEHNIPVRTLTNNESYIHKPFRLHLR